ncbi:MAG: hypothetical protein ACOCX5_00310 [Chloroflexota bacterium]
MTENPELEYETDQQPMDDEAPRTPFEEFLYHQRRALEETGRALEALLPEGFRTHGSNASKEFTKGFRVLLDAAMNELRKARQEEVDEEDDEDQPPSTTGKTKVKVNVD